MGKLRQLIKVSRTLLLLCLAGSVPLWALEQDGGSTDPRLSGKAEEQAFRKAIRRLESYHGAYAPGLSEQLLSLGLAMQSQDRHQEAVQLFKRGVHLARINDGLYSEGQIPLLQGEIASHLALGQYSEADDRQRYMYRVQLRSMSSGQPRAMAFMQQANWQYNAYRLRLGQAGFSRLMNMWDLYRLALTDLVKREGEGSAELLVPLQGMLQAQYLIAGYDPQSEPSGFNSADDLGARQELNRFNAYRAQSYDKGSAVILAIHDIEQKRRGEQSLEAAQALVMLGDWQLWHEQRDEAEQSYQNAIMELAQRDDAQVQIGRIFGEPVPLPDIEGARPLPPAVEAAQGDILLEFGVNKRGRVIGLDRVGGNEENKARGHRLMRKLRKTRFRPRFEAGEPVDTEKLVRAYEIE